MDYDPHPDLPEFMRVPVDFSLDGLIVYLNDLAARFELSCASVRIFMSQTQLYSSEEKSQLMDALSIDALFQIVEGLALSEMDWLDHAHVVELFTRLDQAIVSRFDQLVSEADLTSTTFEYIAKAIVCVMYRRSSQDDSEWISLLARKVEEMKATRFDFVSACSALPLLVKEYFEMFLIELSLEASKSMPIEPPIAHPLLGAVKADVNLLSPALDTQAHNLISIASLRDESEFMQAWSAFDARVFNGRVADEILEQEVEGLTLNDIATLLDRFHYLCKQGASLSSVLLVAKEIYESLIGRLVRFDKTNVVRKNVLSMLVMLVEFLTVVNSSAWDLGEIQTDLSNLYGKSILSKYEWENLRSLILHS